MTGTAFGLPGRDWIHLVLVSAASFLIVQVLFLASGAETIAEGPEMRMYEVALSIYRDHKLVPDSFREIEAFLIAVTRANSTAMWQDVYSLTIGGEIFPKHSLLSSIFVLPFVIVGGIYGVAFSNIVVQVGIVCAVHRLALDIRPGTSWITTWLCMLLGTQLPLYCLGVPYDSLGAFLVVGGLACARTWPTLGGWLVGMALFCRPSNLLYAALLPFFVARRQWLRSLGMVGLILVTYLIANQILWGGFLESAHHRMPSYYNGLPVFDDRNVTFAFSVLLTDWYGKLFNLSHGLLPFNLLLICLPWFGWRNSSARSSRAIVSLCFTQAMILFSYAGWSVSSGGNRYLFPAICLLAPFGVCVVDRWREGLRFPLSRV